MRYIVAGNWKMNTSIAEGVKLASELAPVANELRNEGVEMIIAPPFTHLSEVAKVTEGSSLILAAQNCSDRVSGAFTGEVSAAMLKELGVEYVIIGHSERREYNNEGNKLLSSKIERLLENSLLPIYCVGETLEQREASKQEEVVASQLEEALFGFSSEQVSTFIIAYEPVWAIGTGLTATSTQAAEMHSFIRSVLVDKFGDSAKNIPILYGGSCKPDNAMELFAQKDVNGGLIGGASLKSGDFIEIGSSFLPTCSCKH